MIVNIIVPKKMPDGSVVTKSNLSQYTKLLNTHVIDPIVDEWGECTYLQANGFWLNERSKRVTDKVLYVRVELQSRLAATRYVMSM